jgi:hypothetical protein
MSALKRTREAFVGDLTRTRHMLAVSAVILGATFVPLVGGPPEAHEWAELREVLIGPRDAANAAPTAIAELLREARAERHTARVQTAALADDDTGPTALAVTIEAAPEPALLGADEELNVEIAEETLEDLPAAETELEIIEDNAATPGA